MKRFAAYLLLVLASCGCIRNDLPYPVWVAAVTYVEVDGALSVAIDETRRNVEIELEETADISHVRVRSASYRHEITRSEPELVSVHDLTQPETLVLSTYQDYEWTLSARCPIERYFTVKGQIGASFIDDVNRRAVVYIPMSVDPSDVVVTSLKLGPHDISSYEPPMSDIHDFTDGAKVTVSWNGRSEDWYLYVEQTELAVEMNSVNAWTGCAWLSANGDAEAVNGFRYRLKGEEEWRDVLEVEMNEGVFTACLDSLAPLTSYECLAFSGEDETEIYEFTTEAEAQLPNAGFEAFSHAESAVYFSWFDPSSSSEGLASKWWDSGNIGSTTIGAAYSIALPDTDNKMEGGASASLVSRYVVIKFTAGNTFSGEFAGLVGTQGGIINFGRPWTLRPRAVRLWTKYECGSIDVVDSYPADHPVKVGDPDCCQLWVALGDWDYHKFGGTPECPVQVNTTDKGTFFDPSSDSVIAYGSFDADSSSDKWTGRAEVLQSTEDGWVEIEIPMDYSAYDRVPTHIIVSFASSKFGDYFTGSSSSRMWVDDIRLVY